MYICQDKCYRLVPKEDHRFAQVKDYVGKEFFCSICSVVISKKSKAYGLMMINHLVTGLWECPCCNTRPRGYFDLDEKQDEYLWRKLKQSQFYKVFKKEFFRLHDQGREDEIFSHMLVGIMAPPRLASPQSKLTNFFTEETQRAKEISIFPS